ncbi:hypothetical protein P3F83_18285 [Mycobacteroides immunogenum]|uniref:hypothetical protein n=1 Tax=Mycobacteroides immunogenum TaxID=83262 RepID=UPI0025B7A0B8|nr:hypothetical protein [Mycobacteroides immunogenum]WJR32460.1 hypothetical protein P3F83_18285 [Mycobacteroides immunogenum]
MSRTGKFTARGGLTLGAVNMFATNAIQARYGPDSTVWVSKPDQDGDVILTVTDSAEDPPDNPSDAADPTGSETTTTAGR